ncbi:MAG: GTP 3',8-cyclase MoaA [Nitrosomonadales bacterium]|nr:GTP 3',8-cyclase MoaA [Nitrosomonadales bacterium]
METALGLDAGSARIEVQCLLQAALQVNRAWLLTHPEMLPDGDQFARYSSLFERRMNGEPVAYILGSREFYGLDFKVSPATLIPRPETELLVDRALQCIPQQGVFRVLDLGTGSGAIALSIAHARANAEVVAVDASPGALKVATLNLQHHNLGNVRLLRSDWYAGLQGERFDLIVSNPPYIAESDTHLAQGDLRYEPHGALASGTDGLDDIRRIVAQAQAHLNPGGSLLLEHGYDQAEQVRALLQQAGFAAVFSARDLAGIERVSGGSWSAAQDETSILDTLHRPLRDLRISVTDRCNLRCTYCMPREMFDRHHVFLPRAELLSFEEIVRLARSFVGMGVQKIRLTGGEPLLRRGIEHLVASLAGLRTAQGRPVEIAMTTNGVLLGEKAQALRDAGLTRITVSLDSLNDETFRRISDSDVPVQKVLDGIAAAQRAGFAPVKVNMVVQRGVNDHEVMAMAEHFRGSGIVLRFIEYMDVGNSNGWRLDEVVTARQILEQIASRHAIQPIDPDYPGEVAERWRYADGGGEIGVIAAITQAFCHSCTRARLSTDGKLYTCLFASNGLDLRAPLRQGVTDQTLSKLIEECWQQRNDRYSQLRHAAAEATTFQKIEMSYIGG